MQAIILAAGQGKRLQPITDEIPKAMIEINGKPIIQIILEQLKTVGVDEAILIVHHKKDRLQGYFGDEFEGIRIKYCFHWQC